jgi:hypothetical protein
MAAMINHAVATVRGNMSTLDQPGRGKVKVDTINPSLLRESA